jgi:tartrate-resistant acid phosphatase type 5
MDKVAKQIDAKFMLALGDNFYYSGVATENDSRIKATFEKVYTPDSLQFDWYVIAGNHGEF